MLLILLLQRSPVLNPTCKDDCIKIFNKYQDKLTPVQYRNIEATIGNHALEGMFADKYDIDRLVRMEKNDLSYDEARIEAIAEIKSIRAQIQDKNIELSLFDQELLGSNKVEAINLEDLFLKEQKLTLIAELSIRDKPVTGIFDFNYLQAIHKRLFDDVYTFAGKDRFEMRYPGVFVKGETHFTPGSKLPEVSKALFDALQDDKFFVNLDHKEFAQEMAIFFNGLNLLHPFREGNGRTQRLFMESLAQNAGYVLSLHQVSQEAMIRACQNAAKGFINSLEILMRHHLEPIENKR